ncbi:MAG: hypothetical protein QM778_04840 [Myxococcales bacterium]
MRALLDGMGVLTVFALTVLLLAVGAELGFRVARIPRQVQSAHTREPHVGVVLGAMLALLGLLLAFSFGIAESRYSERKTLVIEEANAIGTAYLRATAVAAPEGAEIQAQLRAYVDVLVTKLDPQSLPDALARSEQIHHLIWSQARRLALAQPDSEVVALLLESLNEVINIQEERINKAIYQRLPLVLLATLYTIAFLCLIALGYSAGLSGLRAPFSTMAVNLAVALVLLLIIDMDRPWQHLFDVSKNSLLDVQRALSQTF